MKSSIFAIRKALPAGFIFFCLVVFSVSAYSQMSITGPTCVVSGTLYTYTIAGNWSSSTNMVWTVNGGTISGSSSGTPLPQIHVTFSSSGSVQVHTTNPTSSPSVTVTAAPVLSGGTLSNTSQTINANIVPATINSSTAASGGSCSPSYSYQWQSSPNNVTYTNISGAASLSLSFTTGLASTTYYRRMVTETSSNTTAYSNVATVNVYPPVVGGSINPATQTINYGTNSVILTSTGVSGGTNSYAYQWQSSPDNSTWSNTGPPPGPGATTFAPTNITATTYYREVVSSNGAVAYSSSAVVNVYPQVRAGTITPTNPVITSGTSPGELTGTPATGGGCSGIYSYQWYSSTDGNSFNAISGAVSLSYTPPTLTANTWYLRQVICNGVYVNTDVCNVTISNGTPDMNFVMERSILKAGVTDSATAAGLTSPYDVSQVTQFFDGLGRVVQTVSKQMTPLQNDMVSTNVYDNYGRETVKYLPYPASTNDGNYKATALSDQFNFNAVQYPGEQFYYSEINFENSPLNRALSTYAPGINWAGSSKGVNEVHLANQVSDSVRIWNIAYPIGSIPVSTSMYAAGTLNKTVSTDEMGNQVVEYNDETGHLVLKKVQASTNPGTAHVGWLCTYYVYDELDYLRFIIQPQAVVAINNNWNITSSISNELCFRYEYDAHGHMIIKKVPGAGEYWMVYDIRDRLVMTQDSLLRSQQKWQYTKYDYENRADSTGLITDPTYYNQLIFQESTAFATNSYPVVGSYTTRELLTQIFYDDYSWVSTYGAPIASTMVTSITNTGNFITSYNASPVYAVNPSPYYVTRGMSTGSKTEVLGSNGNQYLYNVSYFDDRGRMIQSQSSNYTGAVDTLTNQYDFTGNVLRSLLGHKKNGNTVQAHTVLTKIDYDQGFRLKHIWKNIDAAPNDQLIDSMQYNELGQLRVKYLGNAVDSLVYDYNIRGWLTGINKNYVGGTTTHYFGMELGYDKSASITGTTTFAFQQYGGNIAGTVWKSAGDGVARKYDFTYDNANRFNGREFRSEYNGHGLGQWIY